MVGLSVVLEGQNSQLELIVNKLDTASNGNTDRLQPQLNKAMVIHQTHIPSSSLPYSPTNINVPPALTENPSSFPAGRETELSSSYSRPPPVFLDSCCFCKAKLMPGRDIYMYKWGVSLILDFLFVVIFVDQRTR